MTGLLAGLGMELPPESDLMSGVPGNPIHYESRKLFILNDQILREFDGWWDAPPDLVPGWERGERIRAFDDEAAATLRQVYGGPGTKVWKDPRLCLLLPYWLQLIDEPAPTVFVWRRPGEVADSLHQRDRSTVSLGLALWEHYNRSALAALHGRPVYVLDYQGLLDDPAGSARSVARWLDDQGIAPNDPDGWDVGTGSSVVSTALTHHVASDAGELSPAITRMEDILAGLAGPHDHLSPPAVDPPPGWASDILATHRELRMAQEATDDIAVQLHDTTQQVHDIAGQVKFANDEVRRLSDHRDSILTDYGKLESLYHRTVDLAELRRDALESLEEVASQNEAELVHLRSEVVALRHEGTVARQHADRLEQEIERIHASRSWRLTAPLRRSNPPG